MIKRSFILVVLIVLVINCATVPRYTSVEKPSCEDDTLWGLCVADDYSYMHLVPIDGWCGYDEFYYGPVIEKNCFRLIDKYLEKLEIRDEECSGR